MRNKQIIKAYIKEKMPHVLCYGAGILILFVLAGLYHYDNVVINMSYGLFLILFFSFIYGIYDFFRYRDRCLKLAELILNREERDLHLQMPLSLPEKLYQEIILAQEAEKRQLVTEYDIRKKDMADYYTMWIHQIKTPIAALHLLLEEDGKDGTAPKQKDLQAVQKNTGGRKSMQMNRLASEELFKIEQYAEMALHYARLESLSADLSFKEQNIYEMVKQAVKKYAVLFIGSGLNFSMEEFSCMAVTDEKWITFVLEQILSNALKYTKKGGISIYGADASGKKKAENADYVVIEDTGIGILKEDLPRIFERGFTGYNGRMDKKSTGIGLYLCRQIVDRLSHTLIVKSEEGKGTQVFLGFTQQRM